MRRLRILLAGLLATQMVLLATPAAAQTGDTVACPAGLPPAGYTDVSPGIHYQDINCIALHGITTQVGTYDPLAPVTREQMALFITRTVNVVGPLPGGTTKVFTDVGHLSSESQLAIDNLAGLSITSGATATTYDPASLVTREQMALFLTRAVRAASADLPDGAPQGFADVSGLAAESQTAINQAKQMGITAGSSPTTFDPFAVVTREQMASFLARTLDEIWRLGLLDFSVLDCSGDAVETCSGSVAFPANRSFRVTEGFFSCLCDPIDLTVTNFTLSLDGNPALLTEKNTVLDGVSYRLWEVKFPAGLTGTHAFTAQWSQAGVVELIVTMTVDFA
ncbi:MAG: S-layer homology domain-containing protein [Acidimicrobiia bacterium]